ncbi:gluconate 2-dehydrogenase subunit 3 family protein [Shewanella sp. 202IG2-18]|uniref:gluconate 2-dehydrogenase subunit 3 family protein n=1 Tax=Parashewanella hymeniacidonis TaxID=2807618 RepID=UPI00196037CE|nr:gluconate 2-dehydrogenase subunit 3 family protein [Parashewanella hymeniacidonis]MBM7071846.1 gluconate 2-dehydrogenase subunit 3 family protein [Parashewanella hymeniacidonis]
MIKSIFQTHRVPKFAKGLSRRAFLKGTTAFAVLAGAGLTRPSLSAEQSFEGDVVEPLSPAFLPQAAEFNPLQTKLIKQVQLHLFPDDGDGPSAHDLNAFGYLQWALNDPDNQEDGDRAFLIKGTIWLDESANKHFSKPFLEMSVAEQAELLHRINGSQSGENWLSLLLYYLLEAVTLDPLYGGNTKGEGWKWLEHQAGFPRPNSQTHYRVFEEA